MPSDRCQCPAPDAFQPGGLLGRRIESSRTNRLHHQEEDYLLWPFQEGCLVGYMHPDRPHPNYERVSHITYQVWLPYWLAALDG